MVRRCDGSRANETLAKWNKPEAQGSLQLSKVNRRVIADGTYAEVSCAVNASRESPAAVFFEELKRGTWDDPTADQLPDERQAREYYRYVALCKKLANGEELEDWLSYNRLEDGVWELKVGIMRLAFYDAKGDGNYTPKHGEPYVEYDGKTKWLLPEDFDEFIRLANSFAKTSNRTPRPEIDKALQIRREDVQHDRDDEVRS